MKVPSYKVTCKVGGEIVKESIELAFTENSAIGKLKWKLRTAVSSAGPLEFTAVRL